MKKAKFILMIFILFGGFFISCSAEKTPETEKQKEEAAEIETLKGKGNLTESIPEEIWGVSGKFGLSFIRIIGEESGESSQAFLYPADVTVDEEGEIYVLDSGNHRIQKFSREGVYLETIGREGEGPVEFMYPVSLDIDWQGNLVVFEPNRYRIHIISPDGKSDKFLDHVVDHGVFDLGCLPSGGFISSASIAGSYLEGVPVEKIKRLKVYSAEGRFLRSMIDCVDFGSYVNTVSNNYIYYDSGEDGSIYVAFCYQNRVERYTLRGELLWSVSRPLDYVPGFKEGKSKRMGRMVETTVAKLSPCSEGIAVDSQGRAWVLTLDRPLRGKEVIMVATFSNGRVLVTRGDTSQRFTDAYRLDIFSPDGNYLETIRLIHFANSIDIFGDHLFLIDKYRGMQVYMYKILTREER
jgi:hypothetical protein